MITESVPTSIIFDGSGFVLTLVSILHKPRYVTTSIPTITVYGTAADGDEVTLLSATQLSVVSNSGEEGETRHDSFQFSHVPVTSIRWVISNSQNTLDLINVDVTTGLPARVVEN